MLIELEKYAQDFFETAKEKFSFLESYGYRCLETKIANPGDYRDTIAQVFFVSETVIVEIIWYFAGASIGVAFVETQDSKIPKRRVFWGNTDNAERAISLNTLAKYLNNRNSNYLNGKISFQDIEKRLPEVLEDLARATKEIAAEIINGDTSIFGDVMKFQAELYGRR